MDELGEGWAAFSIMGDRTKQSDCYRVITSWGGGILVLLCDGHGYDGGKAADLAAKEFPKLLDEEAFETGCPQESIQRACIVLDRKIKRKFLWGTTLVLAHVQKGRVIVANVGDSRATLIYKEHFLDVTHDHLVTDPDEHKRLITANAVFPEIINGSRTGKIDHNRILSLDKHLTINLSRALGDRAFGDLLIPEPYIEIFDSFDSARFLMLHTDGVWTTFDETLIVSGQISGWLFPQRTLRDAALRLRKEIENRWPNDNSTAVLVNLKPFHV